ncbi:hypothetical protein ACHAWU_001209 [Discostella pseudostelligera]|uniref:Uncharacterized protein n=1 Tax=Discostella pseudostelligera TaxID=259834 RepID=A0ABD3M8X2_9STRA
MSSSKASGGKVGRKAAGGRGGGDSDKDPTNSNTDTTTTTSSAAAAAAAARAQVFNTLQAEMDLADYARGTSGQKVKRVPRNQILSRSAKRKALREADRMEMAIEVDDDMDASANDDVGESEDGDDGGGAAATVKQKRLRGSKVAFQDVVLKSMPLTWTNLKRTTKDYAKGEEERNEVSKSGLIKRKTTKKRVMHCLREFAPQRLAKKHGEAIGAHIRGMSETAAQKLREVAKAAPGAPQVYSSLGMVYESMLTETEGEDPICKHGENGEAEGISRLDLPQQRMELAHKTYASSCGIAPDQARFCIVGTFRRCCCHEGGKYLF